MCIRVNFGNFSFINADIFKGLLWHKNRLPYISKVQARNSLLLAGNKFAVMSRIYYAAVCFHIL
jgi:hypothetical protein